MSALRDSPIEQDRRYFWAESYDRSGPSRSGYSRALDDHIDRDGKQNGAQHSAALPNAKHARYEPGKIILSFRTRRQEILIFLASFVVKADAGCSASRSIRGTGAAVLDMRYEICLLMKLEGESQA